MNNQIKYTKDNIQELLYGKIQSMSDEELLEVIKDVTIPRKQKGKYSNSIKVENEQWKKIPNTNNLYEISDYGRVRKNYITKSGEELCIPIEASVNAGGYKFVVFTIGVKNQVGSYVHNLMMRVFNPVEDMDNKEVIHIDCVKLNNTLSNLQWVSIGDKDQHLKNCRPQKARTKIREYINASGKVKQKLVKISDGDAYQIRRLYKLGMIQRFIAIIYGITQGMVSRLTIKNTRSSLWKLETLSQTTSVLK